MTISADLARRLFQTERELAHGSGSEYERHLTEDALVVIPGQVLDKPATIEAMNSSAGWDEFEFSDERTVEYDDTVVLSYRFRGRRGEDPYEALLSSVYVYDGSEWRLALHQQTPLG